MSFLTNMTWPWSRRKEIFDPLTPLDQILLSPLRILVVHLQSFLLYLRGPPFKPSPNRPAIRVVCISDTHTNTPDIPNGDLLIHSGDLTNAGTAQDIQAQLDWLASQPHKHKVIIAGNHDSFFDTKSRTVEDKKSGVKLNHHNLHYLQNQSVQLKFKGGRVLNLYGAGDIPACGGPEFAFQYPHEFPPWKNRIPIATDVLVTHTPPTCHKDLLLGCPGLLQEIWRVQPRLHVFGHIHADTGREAVFWDEGQAAYERVLGRTKTGIIRDLIPSSAWIDAIKVLWFGTKGILWQHLMVGSRGGNGSLLINAAMVSWKTADVIANKAQIVDL